MEQRLGESRITYSKWTQQNEQQQNSTAANTSTSGLAIEAGRSVSTGRGRGGERAKPWWARKPSTKEHRFQRHTAKMNGNVFECYDEQTDCR